MYKQKDMEKKISLLVIAAIWLLTSCKEKKQYFEESGTVFHTLYQIKYESDHLLSDKIDAEFQKFNLSLNPFNPNSIISKVNNNEPVEVDDWFKEVFNKSMEVSRNSDGVFDITCAPLVNLWGFGFSHKDSVTPEMVRSMAERAIVFSCANPVPEISREDALDAGAAVVGTGSSEKPNQINNVLVFPGLFRGALDVRAKDINFDMMLAASRGIAECVGDRLSPDFILPYAYDKSAHEAVAKAVAEAAIRSGAARI